ncbi:MAG: FTR1 family protein [Methylophilaceae bacterium]|nr:FTR1 family protein [Methylophilaceae bacterium]
MFGTAVIVFRESLEAVIIIGILAAATQAVPRRGQWIAWGVILGLLGAGIVAAFADVIGNWASGIGQELFNAVVLGVAVLMLAWHSIWMSSHGAALAKQARNVGKAIKDGRSECSILMVLVSVAVLREGSETALFLYGIASSANASASIMLTGGVLGLLAGILVGYLLYAGLLRIPLHHFFNATGALVLLLAAGMASQAAGFLIQADVIPGLISPLWDTSTNLPEKSVFGTLLHGLVGYNARPDAMQVLFYFAALISIYLGMQLVKRSKQKI